MYSYNRTASGWTDLKSLSPKLYKAVEKAIREEKEPKVKKALQDAKGHLDQALDLFRVAEHEAEQADRE